MRYEQPYSLSKAEAVEIFRHGEPEQVSRALIGLALHEPDWQWVQEVSLQYLNGSDTALKMTAATALGHIARIHGSIDAGRVVPALRNLMSDPAVGGRASDALDDIAMFVGLSNDEQGKSGGSGSW